MHDDLSALLSLLSGQGIIGGDGMLDVHATPLLDALAGPRLELWTGYHRRVFPPIRVQQVVVVFAEHGEPTPERWVRFPSTARPLNALRCPTAGTWTPTAHTLAEEQARELFPAASLAARLHPWLRRSSPAERLASLPALELLVHQAEQGFGSKTLGRPHHRLDTFPGHMRDLLLRGVHVNRSDYDRTLVVRPENLPEERGGVFLESRITHETQADGYTERLCWVELEITSTSWCLHRRPLYLCRVDGEELS